ncbi:glycosyltransferase family 4 protein [Halotalea alkalilenta]|uniref:glycosyltransferase family 4 protein n=1 Tax=Halotalea alkalilenta TaxID=376489 RepID=UPI00048A267D|nr:glycosyltransferase family 4 protein [Halotalea alkalilenta]
MKIALVTDWLISYAGSEKVEEAILGLFPEADVYTCVYDPDAFSQTRFVEHEVKQSFISRLPKAKTHYQKYLPLMPYAVEQFDLAAYDVIISSSHAVAKGVLTGPDQLHVCYCHTPIRYAWDFQHQYLAESGMGKGIKGIVARYLLHRLRLWDVRTANGVDFFVANSRYIARRINKVYRRDAEVIYPNVAVDDFSLVEEKDDFYLAASRLVPYKRVALIVEAFTKMPDKRLVVIGHGEQMGQIKQMLTPNITYLGYQPFAELKHYMEQAKAFVFAAEEDFGIMPIEAQACGTPVIAYGRGGALETVVDGETGIHFHEQSCAGIVAAVERFEREGVKRSPALIRSHAERFSRQRFDERFKNFVDERWSEFRRQRGF